MGHHVFRAILLFTLISLSASQAQESPCLDDPQGEPCPEEKQELSDLEQKACEHFAQEASKEISQSSLDALGAVTDAGAAGSLLDLLPNLIGSLGFGDLLDEEGTLTLEHIWTPGDAQVRLAIAGMFHLEPGLFQPLEDALQKALSEEDFMQQKSILLEEIGESDRIDLRLRLAFERDLAGRRMGRDFADYEDLFKGYLDQVAESEIRKRQGPMLDRAEFQKRHELVEDPEEFKKVVEEADPELLNGYDRLGDLVANQPQFILTGLYSSRNGNTGPDEISATVDYEMGLNGNVNDFISWSQKNQRDRCSVITEDNKKKPSYECLLAYLKAKPKAGEKMDRFKFSLNYSRVDAFEPAITLPDFTFQTDEAEKWTGSLTYGRELPGLKLFPSIQNDSEEAMRFDLKASYEETSGDPMMQSRFVATATLSQKLTACTVFSVSGVYANRPQFRGEVDEEFSTRFGIKYGQKQLEKCRNRSKK